MNRQQMQDRVELSATKLELEALRVEKELQNTRNTRALFTRILG